MLFNLQYLVGFTALLGAVTAAPVSDVLAPRGTKDKQNDACNADHLATSRADGVPWDQGIEGADHYFCTARWEWDAYMTGIDTWSDGKRMTGIQFYYSDGNTSGMIGSESNPNYYKKVELRWKKEQPVTELRLWRSDDGGAVGGIRIKAGGKTLEVKGKMQDKNVGTAMNVGNGKLAAVRGRTNAGPHVQTLELRFLPK